MNQYFTYLASFDAQDDEIETLRVRNCQMSKLAKNLTSKSSPIKLIPFP